MVLFLMLWKRAETTRAKTREQDFNTKEGILSGPVANESSQSFRRSSISVTAKSTSSRKMSQNLEIDR